MAYDIGKAVQPLGYAGTRAVVASIGESVTAASSKNMDDGKAELTIAMISSCSIFCECLEEALRARAPRIEMHSFADADEASANLDGSTRFTLAILYIGVRKAGDPSVSAEITALSGRISIPIVVLAEGEEIDDIKAAIEAGARGYVSTSMPLNVAVEALQMVRAGGMFIPASCIFSYHRSSPSAAKVAQHASEMIFTARQAAVVRALRQGMANKRIAYELNMCESTVKVHVRNIMRKLNARNRTEVAFRTNDLFAGEGVTPPIMHGRA